MKQPGPINVIPNMPRSPWGTGGVRGGLQNLDSAELLFCWKHPAETLPTILTLNSGYRNNS
jgi:hypothetical protein